MHTYSYSNILEGEADLRDFVLVLIYINNTRKADRETNMRSFVE